MPDDRTFAIFRSSSARSAQPRFRLPEQQRTSAGASGGEMCRGTRVDRDARLGPVCNTTRRPRCETFHRFVIFADGNRRSRLLERAPRQGGR
jgi:hypothetical protein